MAILAEERVPGAVHAERRPIELPEGEHISGRRLYPIQARREQSLEIRVLRGSEAQATA